MIISLSGKKGSGKDTAADLITEEIVGFDINRVSFAAKLKEVCKEVFDLTGEQVNGEHKETPLDEPAILGLTQKKAILRAFNLSEEYADEYEGEVFTTPREILQYVGTDLLRNIQDDIHLKSMPIAEGAINIVTDTRFPNELEYLKEKARDMKIPFVSINLVRGEQKEAEHVSEQDMSKLCQTTIWNDESLEELRAALLEAIYG